MIAVGSLLFCLPVMILDAVKYFGVNRFSQRMRTDPVVTAAVFHRCCKVYWERTAVCDGSGLYDNRFHEVYKLEKESISATKRFRDDEGAPSSIVLRVQPLFSR